MDLAAHPPQRLHGPRELVERLVLLADDLVLLLARTLYAERGDWLPFIITLSLFGLCFLGLGVSMWPYVIPTEVTLWDAASPYKSQLFMFVGAAVLVPIILGYTAYAYWVFRGKAEQGAGYGGH